MRCDRMSTIVITIPADQVRPGDRIEDLSGLPVNDVSTSIPGLVIIDFGPWARYLYRGPDGFRSYRVERTESEEDYELACEAIHAANPHRFEGEL